MIPSRLVQQLHVCHSTGTLFESRPETVLKDFPLFIRVPPA